MNYWLMKSEPDVFSYADLVKKGKAEWDGVRNHAAQLHMKAMRKGDLAFFYHSNIGKECVGIMRITEESSPDPTAEEGSPWVIVRVAPVRPLAHPVTLAAIKADPKLADMDLIRQSRLSVMPIAPAHWALCAGDLAFQRFFLACGAEFVAVDWRGRDGAVVATDRLEDDPAPRLAQGLSPRYRAVFDSAGAEEALALIWRCCFALRPVLLIGSICPYMLINRCSVLTSL